MSLILIVLAITVPTACDNTNPAWAGYYQAGAIHLSAATCAALHLRRGCDRVSALDAVDTIAHELEHARQDRNGENLSEREAVMVARHRAPGMLRRLERWFGVRCHAVTVDLR